MGIAWPKEFVENLDFLAKNIAKNSPNSIKAYKDLYSAARNKGQIEGLNYEAETSYDIPEVKERVQEFLKKLK